jgi:ankyrin repeat protein
MTTAVIYGAPDMLRLLIDEGANPNARGNNGVTALMSALQKGDVAGAGVLLEAGADASLRDRQGNGIFHFCPHSIPESLLKSLLAAGAELNTPNNSGITPLQSALHGYNMAIAEKLIKLGADPNTAGSTTPPLHLAVQMRSPSLVDALIKAGAKIDALDIQTGATALHYATALNGTDSIVAYLLQKKADIAAKDKSGNTPLHNAVRYTYNTSLPVVQLLLNKGADALAKNSDGITPYDMVWQQNHPAFTELFKNHLKMKGIHYTPKGPQQPRQGGWPPGWP